MHHRVCSCEQAGNWVFVWYARLLLLWQPAMFTQDLLRGDTHVTDTD